MRKRIRRLGLGLQNSSKLVQFLYAGIKIKAALRPLRLTAKGTIPIAKALRLVEKTCAQLINSVVSQESAYRVVNRGCQS